MINNNKAIQHSKTTFKFGGAILALVFISMLLTMVIPLSPTILDICLLLSLALSISLLVHSFFVVSPLKLSSFPSLILITTLFRLGLNIASTRLILNEAHAGHIIATLGEFVSQGSLTVGLIIFVILTIIQFIIITKGSERVAEVAARFTLDAMPGKQMSIDADLRAGMISQTEAKEQREALHHEARFYGAMDGAMKFVKGDAIACIIIILVNLVGGIGTGVLEHDMTLGESAQIYSLMTIGDGLFSQLTSILVALTAGFLITRVNSGKNESLGNEIGTQMLSEASTYYIAGSFIGLLGLIPTLPTLTFLAIATLLCFIGLSIQYKNKIFAQAATGIHQHLVGCDNHAMTGVVYPLHIEISHHLYQIFASSEDWKTCFNDLYPRIKAHYSRSIGIEFPELKIAANPLIKEPLKYKIFIYDNLVDSGFVAPEHYSIVSPGENKESLKNCNYLHTSHGTPVALIKAQQLDGAKKDGLNPYTPQEIFIRHLAKILKKHAADFIDIQQTRNILNNTEMEYPELVREVIPRQVSLQKLTEILCRLVEEGVPIKDMRLILQSLAFSYPENKDSVYLTEQVRIGLKKTLTQLYSTNNCVQAMQLDPQIEDEIRASIQKNGSECYLAIDPKRAECLAKKVQESVHTSGPQVKLLTQVDIRRYVKKLIEQTLPDIPVLSFQELDSAVLINSVGMIQ